MMDALGHPQSVFLAGGTSEIGLAIVRELMSTRIERLVLAGRNHTEMTLTAASFAHNNRKLDVLDLDISHTELHEICLDQAFGGGDIDVARHANPGLARIHGSQRRNQIDIAWWNFRNRIQRGNTRAGIRCGWRQRHVAKQVINTALRGVDHRCLAASTSVDITCGRPGQDVATKSRKDPALPHQDIGQLRCRAPCENRYGPRQEKRMADAPHAARLGY